MRTRELTPAQRTLTPAQQPIARWMRRELERFIDPRTGEANLTALVEAWDQDQGDGSTTDPDHDAWDVAVIVAEEAEALR
jgi:hypothetical protein